MDLNVIKKRLESLNKQPNNNSGGEKKNIFFKPSLGKQVVRVVPSQYNKQIPFTEMMFYYGIGSKNVIASPSNWGEKDPIAEFAKQLRQTNDKENWRLAKKLDPKVRIFAPVVVRGEENEGIKLWQFGKEVYQDFLNMAADDEIGDFTDIVTGRDVKLNTVGPEVTGTPYNKTTISTSLKESALSEDKNLVEKFINQQPDPLKVFKKYTYEEVKQSLQEWLAPEDSNEEGSISSEPAESFDDETSKSNYSLSKKATPKKSKSAQFDDLFDGEESESSPF